MGTTFQGHTMCVFSGDKTLLRIAAIKNVSLDLNTDMKDVNNAGTGDYDSVAPGRRKWSASGNGHFQFDAGFGYEKLFDAHKNKTKLFFLFTDEADDIKYYARGYLASLKATFPDRENSTYDYAVNGGVDDFEKLDVANEVEKLTGWTNVSFAPTFASTGANITSAIDAGAGDHHAISNDIALTIGDVLKFTYTLTRVSGAIPVLKVSDGTNDCFIVLSDGANHAYVGIPATGTYKIYIYALTVAENFALLASLKLMNL